MYYSQKITCLVSIILILSLHSPVNASIPASWGVNVGDIAVYELTEAKIDNGEATTDIVGSLPDSNKTTIVAITAIGNDYLNYSLGMNNGTVLVPNQQLRIESMEFEGNQLIVPNGSLPIILPLSVEEYNTYMQKLASDITIVNFLISEMFRGQNITIELKSVLTNSGHFNISATIASSNITAISGILGMNLTEFSFQNETLLEINFELIISYSRNTGLLNEFIIGGSILTNSTDFGEIDRTFKVRLTRTAYIRGEETINSGNNESPVFLSIVFTTFIISPIIKRRLKTINRSSI